MNRKILANPKFEGINNKDKWFESTKEGTKIQRHLNSFLSSCIIMDAKEINLEWIIIYFVIYLVLSRWKIGVFDLYDPF